MDDSTEHPGNDTTCFRKIGQEGNRQNNECMNTKR